MYSSVASAFLAISVALSLSLTPTVADADVLDDIVERGSIRLGYRLDAPPFSYAGADNAPAGLAVALCREVADGIGRSLDVELRLDWRAVTAKSRFEALKSGEIDLLCGPTTQTISRRALVDFSIPYFVAGAGAVFRQGGAERLRDLFDEAVGVVGNTTTETLVKSLRDDLGASWPIKTYANHVEGLTALQAGEVEAYFGDQSILYYQLGQLTPKTPLKIASRKFSREPYALTMPRGESRLRLRVDDALSRLYDSERMFELVRLTLGRLDLSEETRAILETVTIPE